MGLKDIIRRKKLIEMFGHEMQMTLPGEPLIYSVQTRLTNRTDGPDYFRDRQHIPKMKCIFPKYISPKSPVVLLVNFYVSPLPFMDVPEKIVKSEAVATHAYEICEYLLSFMQMVRCALLNSYRQIVKIDAEKYYSSDPRTVFKFMSWSNYETLLRGENPVDATAQLQSTAQRKQPIPPSRARKTSDTGLCVPGPGSDGNPPVLGSGDGPGVVLHAPTREHREKPASDPV